MATSIDYTAEFPVDVERLHGALTDRDYWAARVLAISGEDATDKHVRDRQVGFVFQHYALFRHMTVFENVAFGLSRTLPRAERQRLVRPREQAPVAQALYEETAESLLARAQAAEARRLAAEPALAIAQGRPTKRDRRDIGRVQHDWQRWSASIDDGES